MIQLDNGIYLSYFIILFILVYVSVKVTEGRTEAERKDREQVL
jgi:hypothetical protein